MYALFTHGCKIVVDVNYEYLNIRLTLIVLLLKWFVIPYIDEYLGCMRYFWELWISLSRIKINYWFSTSIDKKYQLHLNC